ncbi:MAG: hypothetical protein HY904_06235 [Deltaproteobacteria bacterium]|nr:hypothetical protein [Deltaproteobacteria bacterium]
MPSHSAVPGAHPELPDSALTDDDDHDDAGDAEEPAAAVEDDLAAAVLDAAAVTAGPLLAALVRLVPPSDDELAATDDVPVPATERLLALADEDALPWGAGTQPPSTHTWERPQSAVALQACLQRPCTHVLPTHSDAV